LKEEQLMDLHPQAVPPSEPHRPSGRFGAEELRAFERLLQRRRQLLLGNVRKLEDEACRKGSDAAGDLSTMPLHPADQATDTQEQDLSLVFMENENVQLQDIEEALERIREGRFGRCEECGHDIAFERLRAIPYAPLCVECQRRQEEEAA
jgi:RNA polymerase-binding protein DksA